MKKKNMIPFILMRTAIVAIWSQGTAVIILDPWGSLTKAHSQTCYQDTVSV